MYQKSRKLLSLLLALTLALTLLPAASFAADSAAGGSGCASVPKMTRQEIEDLLSDPVFLPDDLFVTAPSCTAPYQTGRVRDELLAAETDRLNVLRRLAGLPDVELDARLCEQAQYGAVILGRLGGLTHFPARPDDMDKAFYDAAYAATSSSNLAAGVYPLDAPDGFMDDSDIYNLSCLGHRRWQLNPTLGKVGFGYVDSGSGYIHYSVEKVFDESGTASDYQYIAWPASGNFPGNLSAFGPNSAWSVSLNPARFRMPSASTVTVTLTRASDGKTWRFSGQDSYQVADSGLYFNIDYGGYGIDNCIIFRPDGIGTYEGVYSVSIDGLQDRSGNAASISYQVDFFQTDRFAIQGSELTGYDGPGGAVTVPAGITRIGGFACYNCAGLTGVTLPGSVTEIGAGAFCGCTGLTSVTISAGVTSIGDYAFYGCTGLNDVYYAGTEQQWNAIRSGSWYDFRSDLSGAVIHYNSTGPVKPVVTKTAVPTNDKLSVNGSLTEQATVYKIGSSNYFKLRDVAALLNGTSSQFNVGYENGTVILTTGQGYSKKKSDLKGAAKSNKQVVVGRDTILIDGVEKELKAYKIGGNNYFKLRDLGKALGFKVGYQNGVATITAD